EPDGRGGFRALQLVAPADPRPVLGEPGPDFGVPGPQLVGGQRGERRGVVGVPAEQQHVFHAITSTQHVEQAGRQVDILAGGFPRWAAWRRAAGQDNELWHSGSSGGTGSSPRSMSFWTRPRPGRAACW